MSLDITNPELIEEWNEEKNGSMKNYTKGLKIKVWWICKKYNHHEWEAPINEKTQKKRNCSICCNQLICPKDQCNSLYYNCSKLLKKEWIEEKNGSMKNYTKNSSKKVFWKCIKNNHHIWKTSIYNRNHAKNNCPICLNKIICEVDYCNTLYNNCNELIRKEWDNINNGSMKNYFSKSNKIVNWICSKINHHQWKSSIKNRLNLNRSCPYCTNQKICSFDQCNSLYYNHNEILKIEWDEDKNGSMKNYSPNSEKKVWWKCSKIPHHIWQTCIKDRNGRQTNGCPYCSSVRICTVDHCNTLFYNCKEILKKEWIEEKNGSMKNYFPKSEKKVYWYCSNDQHHIWNSTIGSRNNDKNVGCPICSNKVICPLDQCNSLYYKCNELLKEEWNKDKNGNMKNYFSGSDKKVSWKCKNNHEWVSSINDRVKRISKCPKCNMCPSCGLWRTMGKLCDYCQPNSIKREKTKEMTVVKYLKSKLPNHEFIHNKSVGTDCTNGHLFPDIRFDCVSYQLIVEIDEYKHRGANYQCDEKRMYDIIAKLGQPCIFIRYNPDDKNSNKNTLLQYVSKYLDLDDTDELFNEYGLKTEYLFY